MPPLSRRSFMKHSAALGVAATALPAIHTMGFAAAGDFLEAGVAVRDITPELGIQLWGYSDVDRAAEGVISPLLCKAVVFRAGDKSLALVALDLGRMPVVEQCQRIREAAKADGIEQVILCASHTHSAPFMELPDLPHLQPTEQAIIECIKEAAGALQPARVGVGRATIDISHNRRLIKEGTCYMMWRNAERKPTAPIDHEAGIIRIDAAGGKPLATLVQYACHPVIFGPDNKKYSADWPGEMCSMVKAATGAECLYLQGAAGDINPYLDKTPIAEGGVESMQAEGRKAAKAVVAAWKKIDAVPPKSPSLAYREERIALGTRYDFEDPKQAEILRTVYDKMYDFYMVPFAKDPVAPLGVLVLNNKIALAFVPGELFVQFQLDLKQKSLLPDTFLCGYANDFHIYFPTIKDAAIGGYGASTATYVGIGAGEKLIDRAAAMIGEMTGHFGPVQGPEEFALNELPAEAPLPKKS